MPYILIQNEKYTDFKIHVEGRRLHVQNRSEGGLFYNTFR